MTHFEYLDKSDTSQIVSSAKLKELADSGIISPETRLRKEGSINWTTAQHVKGLVFNSPKSQEDVLDEVLGIREDSNKDDLINSNLLEDASASGRTTNHQKHQRKWQSRHRDRWDRLATLSNALAQIHFFFGWLAIALGVIAFFLLTGVSQNTGDTETATRAFFSGISIAIGAIFVAIPVFCLGVVLRAISLFSLDRADG